MGKWNRRWIPRRKSYQEPPESFHRVYQEEAESADDLKNSVPSWEKQFCTKVGTIPWGKVVVAKKYMYCHDNVVKWNDSAGEEAFNNAKERFRTSVNGLPCDIPLPDPDIYIDEIDWNPHIDPEMIMELDREYFNPEEGRYNSMKITNQKAQPSVSARVVDRDGNLNKGDNNVEGNNVTGTGASNQWGDSINESKNSGNATNPWEQSYTQGYGEMNGNEWRSCGDKSWGWNQGLTCNEQSKNVHSPWEHANHDAVNAKEKGWGGAVRNSSGWGQWETNVHEPRKFNPVGATSAHTLHRGNGYGKYEGWRDSGDKNLGWKQWGNQSNELKYLESGKNGGAWGPVDGGCRKREGSHQYSSRYKSLRFQGDDYGTGHHLRKGRNQNRVGFS